MLYLKRNKKNICLKDKSFINIKFLIIIFQVLYILVFYYFFLNLIVY